MHLRPLTGQASMSTSSSFHTSRCTPLPRYRPTRSYNDTQHNQSSLAPFAFFAKQQHQQTTGAPNRDNQARHPDNDIGISMHVFVFASPLLPLPPGIAPGVSPSGVRGTARVAGSAAGVPLSRRGRGRPAAATTSGGFPLQLLQQPGVFFDDLKRYRQRAWMHRTNRASSGRGRSAVQSFVSGPSLTYCQGQQDTTEGIARESRLAPRTHRATLHLRPSN